MANNQFTFKTELERFMSHVSVQPNGCWLWTGSLDNGYGRFQLNGKQVRMPRAAWLVHKGPIMEGYEPDHLCRVRACVNTDHMELVTHLVNVQRGDAGKRMRLRMHCPQGHAYAGENLIIRKSGARRCKACFCTEQNKRRTAQGAHIGIGTGGREREKLHCPRGHEYNASNTRVYNGSRYCILCSRINARERYARRVTSAIPSQK